MGFSPLSSQGITIKSRATDYKREVKVKLLILSVLFLSLSLVSCNRGFRNLRDDTRDTGDEGKIRNLTFMDVDISQQKVSINFMRGRKNKNKKMKAICRGVDGCLHVCNYFDYKKCKQFSVDQVISFWLGKIGSYTEWSQAEKDLNLIATDPKVSAFLKNEDQDHHVARALFSLNISADCPMGEKNILYQYSPEPSLYIGPALVGPESEPDFPSLEEFEEIVINEKNIKTKEEYTAKRSEDDELKRFPSEPEKSYEDFEWPELDEEITITEFNGNAREDSVDDAQEEAADRPSQEVQENKKIVDGSMLIQFNFPIFRGFIKKCFGHKTRAFSEMAVEIENQPAFEIGHDVISNACGGNSECIRLAYCSIDSERVWRKLDESVKSAGCEYENFVEMM